MRPTYELMNFETPIWIVRLPYKLWGPPYEFWNTNMNCEVPCEFWGSHMNSETHIGIVRPWSVICLAYTSATNQNSVDIPKKGKKKCWKRLKLWGYHKSEWTGK